MKSPISWRGGKSRLAKKIVTLFPKHHCYVEAFCGAAWVLFAKDRNMSKHEVLNDSNGELINFWKVVRNTPENLLDEMSWDIPSRQIHNELRYADLSKMSEIERARRFYWMTKGSFGGSYEDVFGTKRRDPNTLLFPTFKERIFQTFQRLKDTTIEHKDYKELSKTYDAADTLWYLDPPYLDTNKSGYVTDIELDELVEFCNSLKGKVAISHNHNEKIANGFKGWNFIELGKRRNSIGNNGKTAGTFAREWLITNY